METLGIVRGNTVRARHVEKDILASFRNIVGGEIEEYIKLLAESREQSIDRMIIIAEDIGADGIIRIRFTTSSIMQAAAEMFVYVTAVKLKKKKKAQLLLRGEQNRGWRHVKTGAILKVKVELDKSVRVVIRNQIKEKSTFKITPWAASVVKAFRNMRIEMISTRPGEFWSVMANEGELLEKFGIEVIPVALTEIIASARKYKDKNSEVLKAVVKYIKGKNIDYSAIGEENLKKIVALKLAMKKWVEEEELSAVVIQCWMALPNEYGIAPCFANAMLTDEKIPVVCETDIHGAITAVMLQAANMHKESIFFADLTIRHPEKNNSELLWHCGNFPYSLKAKDSPASVRWHGEVFPGIAHWRLKEWKITVLRFDGDNGKYSLLMGHAHGVEGPQTSGTYLWVEVNDWPLWEERFIRGPYIHHVAGIYGKFAPVLYEACRYIPELIPDAVEPSEEELKKWLRE